MESASETPASVAFGRFRVLPRRRELLADGQPVKLGGRAFDVLLALIEARGAVVGKDALMARVWPDRVVEENNLQAHVSALRAVFGAERDLIRTVSGRGYQFTGEIRVLAGSREEPAEAGIAGASSVAALPPTNLPEPVSGLIGRDAELDEILGLAAAHRLVTLTGAGGIGKTRLAVAVARRLLPQFRDGIWVAELAPLTDPALVPAACAAAVGLELAAGAVSPERVANALSGKRLLLVLDNCEHVIEAAATLVEALLHASPRAQVVATSREPLKTEGEWIYPVPPLAVPTGDGEDQGDPLRYGAVALFVERAKAAEAHFAPDPRLTAMIAAICRRLDGIPLAIELAAARAAALGIKELADRLDDRFRLLTGGRRTALPRHQTLRATLDWSYGLLAEPERVTLRRLAAFAGDFSLEAAAAVAASPEAVPSEVEGLASLVAKSLLTAKVDRVVRYRLLDTTRAYVLEKLRESGEHERLARRHAEYYLGLFERAEAEWEMRPTAEWLADYRRCTDDLRAALDWAFSPAGDAAIGIALTAASIPLWRHLSLAEECLARVRRALAALRLGSTRDPRREMQLSAALAATLSPTTGFVPEVGAAWSRTLEIAESLGEREYQLRALWGLWSHQVSTGHYRPALAQAQSFCSLAAQDSDPTDRLVGDRMIGATLHYLGDQPQARHHIERMLSGYTGPDHRSHIIRFQTDQRVTARVFLARILWLQGFPDQAMRTARSTVEDARAADPALSLCYALAQGACPVALYVNDLSAVEKYVGMLLDTASRHGLRLWRAWGRSFEGILVIRRGDDAEGLRLLRAGFDELGAANSHLRYISFLNTLARTLGRLGLVEDGLAAVDEALDRSRRTEELWRMPEFLRTKGELLLRQGGAEAAPAAEHHFRQALDWARRQGALGWELRAAESLARLLHDLGRPVEAATLLQPVYDRFTEGFDTADLKSAKALLDALR